MIALSAKLRYKARIEYSTPKKPPKINPSFTSPNPILSFFKINCPIKPIKNKNPAKTNDPDTEYSHPIDNTLRIKEIIKTNKPNKINPFGMIKWSISTKVTAIRRYVSTRYTKKRGLKSKIKYMMIVRIAVINSIKAYLLGNLLEQLTHLPFNRK